MPLTAQLLRNFVRFLLRRKERRAKCGILQELWGIFSEEFKLQILVRVNAVGVQTASKEQGLPKVLLIGWMNIQDEKFQCEQCGKCFGFESKIKRHRTTTHTKSNVEFKFNCEQCGRLFEDEQKLSSHSLAHTAERTLPCDEWW